MLCPPFDARSSHPDMDSCFRGVSTPNVLAPAVHIARVAVLEHSRGNQQYTECNFFSPVFPTATVQDLWPDVPILDGPCSGNLWTP